MTPDQRQRALANLPPERRAKVQRLLDHYDRLSPRQRERLDWFSHLAPERQDAFREAYKRFQNEPLERQQSMRVEISRLRMMSGQERAAHLAGSNFQSRFNQNEQHLLGQLSNLLPDE